MSGTVDVQNYPGFAKSTTYDTHRPSYSPTATAHLLQQCRLAGLKGAKILDLAAGTGKFTEALVQRDEAYEVLAVEPHDGMRGVLEKKRLKGVRVMEGKADAMSVEDEEVDGVVVAQAFHWFANKASLKEIHRVLKPHGCLGLIWNVDDNNAPLSHTATTTWESQIQDLTWTFKDGEPRFRHEQWRKVFEDQSKATTLSLIIASEQFFSLPLGEWVEPYEMWMSKEEVWERYNTISHISVLEGKERERTKETFMDALNADDVEVNEQEQVALHGKTYVVWTSKIPEDGRENLTEVERPGA